MPLQPLRTYDTVKAADKVYPTNIRPILISVSDETFSSYVVKHNNGLYPCNKLAYELLSYYFLQLWSLETPEAAVIQINPNHIKYNSGNNHEPRFFRVPCWGTKFYAEGMEFNRFFENLREYERIKFENPIQLVKIILFDLWVSNEDRTANNTNT